MGLSSLFNPDILIGMGQAHQLSLAKKEEERKNLLTQESERRKQGTSLFKSLFEHPDLTPEGRDEALRQINESMMAKPDKEYKFDINRVLSVRPQVGKSVASSMSMGDVRAPASGNMPAYNLGIEQNFPAPEPPEGYTRSGFYSPDELMSREEDKYRRQQGIQTQEQIKRTRATQQAELEFAPPKPPQLHNVPQGSVAIDPLHPSVPVYSNPKDDTSTAKSLQESEVVLKDGKRVMAFFNPDPAKAGWYVKDPNTGALTDISQQVAGQYRPPQQPSATIQIAREGNAITSGLDQDLGYALDRATNDLTPGRKLAVMSTVQRMVKNNDLTQARDTIRQAALESAPAPVQNVMLGQRQAIAALSSIKQLLNGVPTNLLVGGVENALRALGSTKDKKYVDIATRLQALNQAYRKAITGAQFSIQEAKEYGYLFPSLSNTELVNLQQIDSLVDVINTNNRVFWDYKLGPGWSDTTRTLAPPNPTGGTGTGTGTRGGTSPNIIRYDAQGNRIP